MVRIGLFGYGKMGKTIEQLSGDYGAQIVWRIGRDDAAQATPDFLQSADVVIEFTRPEAAWDNVRRCIEAGVPVVSGTTGWDEHLHEAQMLCAAQNSAFIWASNFSVGVNLFFALNQQLAQLMASHPEYHPHLTEVHHVHKRDAPSGTAISLATQIMAHHPRITHWETEDTDDPHALSIQSIRDGEVPGTHRAAWKSAIDTITIEHEAHSREVFAAGALLAAKWLHGKRGVYTMADVLGLQPA
ncbi:MAG: 4-hydroxy-tetrahydrodipicolinate reductase [Saprospiraceae bacterium]